MKGVAGLASVVVAAAALLIAGPADAQMQPHRAEYTLRLGTALNATRIGTIVQDIARECDGWRIRRELSVDASLTPSFKVSFTSRLEGEELRGKGFAWRALQVVNGTEREVRGTAERKVRACSRGMVKSNVQRTAVATSLAATVERSWPVW